MKLRVALLFQDGNFVGREYYHCLAAFGVALDYVAAVGRMPERSIAIERERTAGRWDPPPLPAEVVVHRFESLAAPALWQGLGAACIDVVVQGGIGILNADMLCVPRIGFVNVHPGRLPQYRGNSCLEWALHHGDEIYATAHLIDEGVDTGPVICERLYEIPLGWDYYDLRANLYCHCARVLVQALGILDGASGDLDSVLTPQDADAGHYWKAIPHDKLEAAIARFGQRAR